MSEREFICYACLGTGEDPDEPGLSCDVCDGFGLIFEEDI